MKIKKDYVLREIADQYVVVPIAEAAIRFNGIISLNKSAKLLWEQLHEEKQINQLIDALLTEYEVSYDQARHDVLRFIDLLKENDLLE